MEKTTDISQLDPQGIYIYLFMLRSIVGNSLIRLSFRDKIVVFEAACTELAEVCEKMAILGRNHSQDSEIEHHLLRFLIFKCKFFRKASKILHLYLKRVKFSIISKN